MGVCRAGHSACQTRWQPARHVVVRDVVNGLMYILSTGCQWRTIPKDLSPRRPGFFLPVRVLSRLFLEGLDRSRPSGSAGRSYLAGSGSGWGSAVLDYLLKDRAFEFPVQRAVFVAALHRLFVSGSDRDCSSWMEECDIPGAEGRDLHHFCRAMAWLGEMEENPQGCLVLKGGTAVGG